MNKKKMIIGIAAGVAVIGAVVTVIVKHNRKKKTREYELDFNDDYDEYEEYEDDFWEEDLDDEDPEDEISPELEEKLAQYHEAAERLLAELENGNYGN